MSIRGICKLCENEDELRQSHIIPKFAVDFLKRSAPTPYLRRATEPDRRVQDIEKHYLLCGSCEQRLSQLGEHLFSERIFAPFQQNNQEFERFDYEEWLLYFAVSLAWRVVATQLDIFRIDHPEVARFADIALEYWRRYLLGIDGDAGPFEHHIFFFGFLSKKNTDVVPGFHAYTLSATDATIGCSESSIMVYSKLPGIMFWSSIFPFETEVWSNTLIGPKGTLRSPQSTSEECGDFLLDRIANAKHLMGKMSQIQQKKVREAVMNDPERWENSLTSKVVEADDQWN